MTRSPRAVVLVTAALLATAFAVTPAYADDPGLNCALTATGSLSVSPSPVVYGQNAQVNWGADGVGCGPDDALRITGPGFDPATDLFPVGGGSRPVFITSTGTVTWNLTVIDLSSDTGFSRNLASVTIPVTGVTVVPNVLGDSQTQASQALSAAGYVVGQVNTVVDCDNVGRVSRQSPSAGTPLVHGSPVALTIGTRPPRPRVCQ
ncbi:PASTA domain-containing protein [Streptomyces sp. NBC_00289]|uniref:PASTA domain-containing protein n=1 Tax=Streptomyces sp. NBC_00289 TaxID=2975703 RepID=UPI00324C14DC